MPVIYIGDPLFFTYTTHQGASDDDVEYESELQHVFSEDVW